MSEIMEVDLGRVVGEVNSETIITYDVPQEYQEPKSGDKIGTLFGKITVGLKNMILKNKVLNTYAELSACNQEEYVAGAKAVNEAITVVNTSLGGCSFEQEGTDFYVTGADSVRKKLGSGDDTTIKDYQVALPKSYTASGSTSVNATLNGCKVVFAGLTYVYINASTSASVANPVSATCSISGNTVTISYTRTNVYGAFDGNVNVRVIYTPI